MCADEVKSKFESYLLTERHVTNNTFGAYQRDINQFFNYIQKKSVVFESITADELKKYVHYLHGLKLTARSISRKISSLKLFYTYLSERYNIKNHAKELYFPKIEKKLPTFLTEDEVKSLLSYAKQNSSLLGVRNMLMLYLLYVSGMRVSELVNLKINDIHFDTGLVSVDGKGGKQRMVPLPLFVLSMIKTYLHTTYSGLIAGDQEYSYLFPVIYGKKIKPISRQSCWIILKSMCKGAGIIRAISPHQLRHSLATHMLYKGADLRSLQVLLGHENIATVEIYTHIETSQLRSIYDKKHPRS